ncbi:protein phosphatase inhibitor [Malassezia pachydermatis]
MNVSHLHWDEENLQENQQDLDNTPARMIVDEPKTPFVHNTQAPPLELEDFQLDASAPSIQETTKTNTIANARGSQVPCEVTPASERVTVPKPPLAPIDLSKLDEAERAEVEAEEARHAEFDRKRHKLYDNEGGALKMAMKMPIEDEEEEES